MAGLIDVNSEVARLEKQIRKLEGDIQGLRDKLGNPGFIDKAPANVVNVNADGWLKLVTTGQNKCHGY